MKELSASEYVFLKWLHETHPDLYQAAEDRQQSLSGFMDSLSTIFTNISNAAPDLLNQYVKGQAELATLKANLKRAQAGDSMLAGIPMWVFVLFGAGALFLILRK